MIAAMRMTFAQGHRAGQWQNLRWKNAEWGFIFIAGSLGLQGDPCWSLVPGQNAATFAKAGLWRGRL